MGTSNAAENRNVTSVRRMPFIGVQEPVDVPDLPTEEDANESGQAKPEAAEITGAPPPQKLRDKLGQSWQWGLLGLGVIAVAGYGGFRLYHSQATQQGASATDLRPALNSTTALNSPRDPRVQQPRPASAPAKAPVEAQPQTNPVPALPTVSVPVAPMQLPATDIATENRKIVASPMMGDDQRQVLDLMAATNSVVLQLKRQVDEDSKRMRELQAQLDDMKRMVSLSQAKLLSAATEIAMGNKQPAPPAADAPADPQPATPTAASSIGPNCRVRPVYTIASASPRHVTLKGGGQLFVDFAPNDQIPCYGRILQITQEGSRWVVKTDHDVIGRSN